MSIKAVIFDFGNVITYPHSGESIEKMAKVFSVAPELLKEIYYKHRDMYDTGNIFGDEYWNLIAKDLNKSISKEQTKILINLDIDSWFDTDPKIWELIEKLQKEYKTALLTNNIHELSKKMIRELDLDRYFSVQIFSNHLNIIKPDRKIYDICIEKLGINYQEAVFIDDKLINIEAADKLGIKGVLFKDYDNLINDLYKLGLNY